MTQHFTPPRRMKRSRNLVMTTLMAGGASVSLAACGDGHVDNTAAIEQGKPVDAYAYASLKACKDAHEIPDAECDKGFAAAQADAAKSAPRYDQQTTCEDVYGAGNCVPRQAQNGGGGSFWGPLITGFVVGRMLDGGWRGTGIYRHYDGGYYTPWGGRLYQDYATGRTKIGSYGIDPPAAIKAAPPKIQTRTSVVSRGGFGGRMSSRSYSSGRSYGGGHWGG